MKRIVFSLIVAATLTACSVANAAGTTPPAARVKPISLAGACSNEVQVFNPRNSSTSFWLAWFKDSQSVYVHYMSDEERDMNTGNPSPEMHAMSAGQWQTPARVRDVKFRMVGDVMEVSAAARVWQIYAPCEHEDATFQWPCDDARWVKLNAPWSTNLCKR